MSGPSGCSRFYSCGSTGGMAGAGFTSSGLSRASSSLRRCSSSASFPGAQQDLSLDIKLFAAHQIETRQLRLQRLTDFFSISSRTREYLSALTHEPGVRFAQFFRVNHCGFPELVSVSSYCSAICGRHKPELCDVIRSKGVDEGNQ